MIKKVIYILTCFITIVFLSTSVYAYENYDTTYNITYDNIDNLLEGMFNSQYTYKEVFDYLLSLDNSNSNYQPLAITYSINSDKTSISSFNFIYVLKQNYSSTLGDSTLMTFANTSGELNSRYYFNGSSTNTIIINFVDDSNLQFAIDCITGVGSGCTSSPAVSSSTNNIAKFTLSYWGNDSSSRNDNSYDTMYYFTNVYIYKTITPLQYSINNSTSRFFKTLVFNDNTIVNVGETIPTYSDLFPSSPTPDPTPDPDPPIESESISDSIYWFVDNSDLYGVMTNIYILLFLYCITIIILKVYDKINKHLNKYRRF